MKSQSLKRGFLQQISKESNRMLQKVPGPEFRKILDTVLLKKEMVLIECMMTVKRNLKYRKRPQKRRKMMTVGWKGTLMNQQLRKAKSFPLRKVKKGKMWRKSGRDPRVILKFLMKKLFHIIRRKKAQEPLL